MTHVFTLVENDTAPELSVTYDGVDLSAYQAVRLVIAYRSRDLVLDAVVTDAEAGEFKFTFAGQVETALEDAAIAGDESLAITVADYASLPASGDLELGDDETWERVSYTSKSAPGTLNLAAPLAYDHALGDVVTQLPDLRAGTWGAAVQLTDGDGLVQTFNGLTLAVERAAAVRSSATSGVAPTVTLTAGGASLTIATVSAMVDVVEVLDGVGIIDVAADYDLDTAGVTAIDAALDVAVARLNKGGAVWNGRPWQLYFRPGTYKLAAEHVLPGLVGVELRGAGKWSTLFRWAGADGEHMLTFRNARSVKVADLDLSDGGIAVASLLRLNRDQAAGDVYASTYVDVERVIGRHEAGAGAAVDFVVIDGDANANDYHRFTRLELEGASRSGVRIESQQQKGTIFDQCSIGDCSRAVYCPDQNGALTWRGGFLYNNDAADFDLTSVIDPFIIEGGWRSEGSSRFLSNPGDSGNHWPLNVSDGYFATNGLHADGRALVIGKCGPIVIERVGLGHNGYPVGKVYVTATAPSTLDLRSCSFPSLDSVNVDPVELIGGHQCSVKRERNLYRTAGNLVVRRIDEPYLT